MIKKNRLYRLIDILMDFWEKNTILVNNIILFCIMCLIVVNNFALYRETNTSLDCKMFLYAFPEGVTELYTNIKTGLSNMMALGGALITLNGVFLTLLVTLKESKVFKEIRAHFPTIHDYMYIGLKKQLYSCILLMFICIVLFWFGSIKLIYVQLLVVWLIGYHLINVSFGAIYSIKNVTDITVKDKVERETALK